MLNSRRRLLTETFSSRLAPLTTQALLLPKLRSQCAEFLSGSLLARLTMFWPPTCVGLRYGQPEHFRLCFSCHQILPLLTGCPAIVLSRFTPELNPNDQSRDGLTLMQAQPVLTRSGRFRNINRISIAYAFRPQLRTD